MGNGFATRLAAQAHYHAEDYGRAAYYLERAQQGEARGARAARWLLLFCYERLQAWGRSEQIAIRLIADGEEGGEPSREALGWYLRGSIAIRAGQLDEAIAYRARCSGLWDTPQEVRAEAAKWGQIADIYSRQGRLADALRIRESRQRPAYTRVGDTRKEAVTWGQIADIYYEQGKLEEALRIRVDKQLPLYSELGDIEYEAVIWAKAAAVYDALGEYHRRDRAGDRAKAAALLGLAISNARDLGLPEAQDIEALMKQLGVPVP